MPCQTVLSRLARHLGIPLITAFLLAVPAIGAASTPASAVHRFDFAGISDTSPDDWLKARDFILEHDAKDRSKIRLTHADDALHLQVVRPAFGFIVHEQDIPGAMHVELHWGVSSFPAGASYEHGIDNEAIMVYVFFGHETYSSGSLFVPDSPYFIGFFLCPAGTDEVEQPYVGHHYKKTGRYICVDHPPPGTKVVSRIDLAEEFRRSFGLEVVPPVSGISIEVDTTDAENDGRAAAFLERIEFLR